MEDGDEPLEEIAEDEEEGEKAASSREKQGETKKTCKCNLTCNPRIDELATPNRRMFLALWNDHAHHFPPEKVNHLKQLLQQLYAMSPEETAKYFAELRNEAKAAAMRKKLKQKLRKYLQEKHHKKQRERAYRLFKRVLKSGIAYAAENPVPPIVSIRLRYLSDIILEQLCDLRNVVVPNRHNTDKLGFFLVSVADWMAIAVERLYYAAQLSIEEMTEEPSQLPTADELPPVPESFEHMDHPFAASTPKKPPPDPYYSFIGTEPIAASTPKKPSSYDTFQHIGPLAASTPQKGMGSPLATSTPRKKRVSRSSLSGSLTGQGHNKTASTRRMESVTPGRGQFGMSPSYQEMMKK